MTEDGLVKLLDMFASKVKDVQSRYSEEVEGNMTEDGLVKLLDMFASKVKDTQSKYSETVSPQGRAFKEVKELVESLQNQTGGCQGPFSEELPEDRTEIGWGWRVYGCKNHAHIIHLKYGYVVVNKELAEKILVLGIP